MVEFTDSTFNVPLEHALEVCRQIIKRRIRTAFSTMGINPGAVTEELILLMKEANFKEVSCAPESGSAKMLKTLEKNFTIEDVRRTAGLLQKSAIPVVWYFLFGGPGESKANVFETFQFIEENIPRHHLVLITSGVRIFPGAPIQKLAEETGQIQKDADLLYPIWFWPEDIDREMLFYLINRSVLSHTNYINLQDNQEDSILAKAIKKVYAALRIEEPVWVNIIRRNFFYRISGYNRYRLWRLESD